MKRVLTGAAIALFTAAFAGTAMASVCSDQCNRNYNQCSIANGANGQEACMPAWMQCKKACNPSTKAPTKASNITPAPKHTSGYKAGHKAGG